MMRDTLLLDPKVWDLLLDASGNIALANPPYALSQDVASAIKTFAGEVWYNTKLGIPYFDTILGKRPPLAYLKAQIVAAALTVPGVVSAQCIIKSFDARTIVGQCTFVDENGVTNNVSF